jgi:hypothetical protein
MKALLVFIILITFVFMALVYKKDQNMQKMLTSLSLFAALWAFAVLGMMTRPVIPLFLLHVVFLIVSWFSLLWYIFRGKYYPYLHLSPLATLLLYIIGEFLFGSGGLDLS